jgi:hypothetical protein
MKWLRLRESGGTLFFDYSADGTNWTSLTSVADPFTLTSFNAVIQQGSYTAVDPQTASQWASCNVLPSPLGGVLGSRRSRVVAYPRASRARSLALARPVPVQPSVRCLQPAAVRRPGPPRERPLPPLVAASGLAPASSRAGHREQ